MPGWLDLIHDGPGGVVAAAPRLLGSTLRHVTAEGSVAVRLTEVEAYDGANDPGSHAFSGRTARNAVMFGPPGRLYVYFTYGMHFCANIVLGPEDDPAAVLLRAGEVVEGVELARRRRPRSTDRDLARGPARLCQALGIDLSHNGAELDRDPLTLAPGTPPQEVDSGPRVGLRKAAELPWRFWAPGDPTVSAYRPAVTRPRKRSPGS